MITQYVIKTKIVKIFEKYESGPSVFNITTQKWEVPQVNLGWAILLEGSYESLLVGKEKPDLKVGQRMRIVIEAEEDQHGK
jgi:hypothetical protein